MAFRSRSTTLSWYRPISIQRADCDDRASRYFTFDVLHPEHTFLLLFFKILFDFFFQFKNKQTNQSLLWVKRNALQWSADAMLRRFHLFYISLSIYTVLLSIFRLDILNSVAVSDVYYHSLELWKMYNWIYLILLGMTRTISSIVHRLVSCIKASGCAIYQF